MQKLILFSILTCFLFSCENGSTELKTEREIKMIYTNWSEGLATTYLVKNVLEEKLGYQVVLKLDDIENIYPQVASGEYELFLDAWLPNTHSDYFAPHQKSLTQAGVIYNDAHLGLVVPEYSPYQSISDLSTYAGKIIGIDSTAGVMKNTKKAISAYELNTALESGSESNMVAALDNQYKRRNDLVVTGWKPHKMFDKHELRFLNDPKNIYGNAEKIYAIANTKSLENDPVLKEFLNRFTLTDRQISNLIATVLQNESDLDAGAKEWIQNNRLIVARWTKNLAEFEEKAL